MKVKSYALNRKSATNFGIQFTYLHSRKNIEFYLMEFLKNTDDIEENYENVICIFNDYKIDENWQDLKEILDMVI